MRNWAFPEQRKGKTKHYDVLPGPQLVDEDVGGRAEQGQGGHQGEDREDQQADSVQHDCCELPVVDDQRFRFTRLDCLSDQPGQCTVVKSGMQKSILNKSSWPVTLSIVYKYDNLCMLKKFFNLSSSNSTTGTH